MESELVSQAPQLRGSDLIRLVNQSLQIEAATRSQAIRLLSSQLGQRRRLWSNNNRTSDVIT